MYIKHDKALVGNESSIGENTRVWAFANIQNGAVVGTNCNICDCCFIEKGAVIGDNVTIKNNVAVFDGITICDDVFVGASAVFVNDRYPRSNRSDQWVMEQTTVERGATIGAGAAILCGVTIGERAVVGAGAVVVNDVDPFTVVVGNPARVIGHACYCGRSLDEDRSCRHCGRNYQLNDQKVLEEIA